MLKHPIIRVAVLGAALLGSAVAWYLISPLFVVASAYDGFPTLRMMPSRTPGVVVAALQPSATQEEQPTPDEAQASLFDDASALLIAEGEFYAVAENASGSANIYLMEEGGLVLRLEDFAVEEGAELSVYLTSEQSIEGVAGEQLEDALDLGELLSPVGDQIYELPENIDLELYHSVVIWSEGQQVAYGAAPLESD
jgi:hypothetical protein